MSKTIGEKLEASVNGLDALLTYANGVTGESDVSIGDAVKTLADGFGGGGAGWSEPSFVVENVSDGTYGSVTFDIPDKSCILLANPVGVNPTTANRVPYFLLLSVNREKNSCGVFGQYYNGQYALISQTDSGVANSFKISGTSIARLLNGNTWTFKYITI